MRRLLKFLHTVAGAAFIGGMGALGVLALAATGAAGTAGYAPLVAAMAKIAAWVIGPSMVVTVIAGLLAMAATPAFQNAGWVWVKAATGILVLEGGLHVMGPIQEEAKRGGGGAEAGTLFIAEANTLWLLLAVSVANIALAIWKPRMPQWPV